MKKRYRRKHAKPGQLLIYYGKLPHDDPDVVYAWGGAGANKYDANYLAFVLGSKRQRMVYGEERVKNGNNPLTFDPSVLEELEARGYDITTIKFSIMKKEVANGSDPEVPA